MIDNQSKTHTNKHTFKGDVTFEGNVKGAGTTVIANPTGEADETLSSIQIGNAKYKLGGKLYRHSITLTINDNKGFICFDIFNHTPTLFTGLTAREYIYQYYKVGNEPLPCTGFVKNNDGCILVTGIYGYSSSYYGVLGAVLHSADSSIPTYPVYTSKSLGGTILSTKDHCVEVL